VRRIVILGCAGSGKTVLAERIRERTGLPVICLDELLTRTKTENDLPAFRASLADIHASESWVSDGNFARVSFDIRLPRADLIVWLERSRLLCSWRACLRVFRRGEAHRPQDILSVLAFIWNFDRLNRPMINAERLAHGRDVPVVHLRDSAEIADFLNSLKTRPLTRVRPTPDSA
jgi:adenylate kinase family enzyme